MAETQKMYLGSTLLNKTYVGSDGTTIARGIDGIPYGDNVYGGYLFFVTGSDYYVAHNANIGGDFNDVLGTDCGTTNGIGTGPNNTSLLAAEGSSVANTALSASYNGYTDWFIPSYALLEEMCSNKSYIPNFDSGNFRSSTEGIGGSDAFYIGAVDLSDCGVSSNTYKSNSIASSPMNTRLVRKQTVV